MALTNSNQFRILQPFEFHLQQFKNNTRSDDRELGEFRYVIINNSSFPSKFSSTVKLGKTIVSCCLSYSLHKIDLVDQLNFDKDTLHFDLNFTLPGIKNSRKLETEATLILNQLFNLVRSTHLLTHGDLTFVNSVKEEWIWKFNCQITCLSSDGATFDCALISLLSALKSVELPAVRLSEDLDLPVVFEDLPKKLLNLSCVPIPASFAIFNNSIVIVDPTAEEIAISSCRFTVVCNEEKTIYLVDKPGGSAIVFDQLNFCLARAYDRASEITKLLEQGQTGDC